MESVIITSGMLIRTAGSFAFGWKLRVWVEKFGSVMKYDHPVLTGLAIEDSASNGDDAVLKMEMPRQTVRASTG